MAISVVMPALEMAQETGKLVSWRKKEGESVAKGEPLLEVETDKAVLEIEAPGDGVLAGVKVQEGEVVPVGQTIAWIVRPGENPPPEAAASASARHVAAEPTRPAVAVQASELPAGTGPRISPKARRLAREHGVDLNSLRGSGPDGAIVAEDVLAAVESPGAAAAPNLQKFGPVGRLMAQRTTESWTTVPHFFVTREVDAGALVQARDKLAAGARLRPSHTDLLVALIARVLKNHPRINARWSPEGIHLNSEINIAVGMAVDEGVVAAVIHNADKIPLSDITVQRQELTERARSGRLRPSDVAGATFTISNLGMYDVDAFSAIISPPQAAILAVGRIVDRVVPILGKAVVRPRMTMTLSCDHRVAGGASAALFLKELAAAAGEPEKWIG